MENNDNIKKLLQELGTDRAAEGFTDKLMNRLQEEELLKDRALRSLLVKHTTETAPDTLKQRVMAGLAPHLTYQPVFGKLAWSLVVLVVVAVVALALVYTSVGTTEPSLLNSLSGYLNELTQYISISPVVTISVLAMGVLLMLERLLARGRAV